jgi:hypothetical protein
MDNEEYRYIENQYGFTPTLLRGNIKEKVSLNSKEVSHPGEPMGFGGGRMTFGDGSATIYPLLVKHKLIRGWN